MPSEKLLKIVVETIEGESVEVTVNEENKVEKLMKEAMDALNIDPHGATYEVRFNNQLLEPSKKVKEYGLASGTTVVLQRRPKVG